MGQDILNSWLSEKTKDTTSVVEFGSMFFDKLSLVNPNVKNKIGIEIWQPYIDRAVFNECVKIQGDMLEFEKLVDKKYFDCALFIDSLEHLTMDKALDLIGRCKKQFNRIIMIIPEGVREQDTDVTNLGAYKYQTHRSTWYREQLQQLGFSYEIYFHDSKPSIFAVWESPLILKYSFLMPYYNRESLEYTLDSFIKHYSNRKDYEVVIIEGKKNSKNLDFHYKLLEIINKFQDKINISYLSYMWGESFNPSKLFNFGVLNSKGKIIILTSPECYHEIDILKGFDEEFEKDRNIYVVCGCRSVKFENNQFVFDKWYQHSQYLNRKLHFCTALTKENFWKVGGFDEEYSKGIAYEDDDFRNRILASDLKIILRDDLLVTHINHDTTYQDYSLTQLNEKYYRKKWDKEEIKV